MKNPNRVQASVIGVAAVIAAAIGVPAAQQAGQQGRGAAPVNDSRTTKEELDKWMKELSNWGRWGKDDQRGAANLITPAKRKQALALARDRGDGVLAHDTLMDKAVDAATPFEHRTTIMAERGIAVEQQQVSFHGSTFTHLDALCHISYQGQLSNAVLVPANGQRSRRLQQPGDHHVQGRNRHARHPPGYSPPEGRAVPGCRREACTSKTSKRGRRRPESKSARATPCSCAPAAGRGGRKRGLANFAGFDASFAPFLKRRDIALIGSDAVLDAGNVPASRWRCTPSRSSPWARTSSTTRTWRRWPRPLRGSIAGSSC